MYNQPILFQFLIHLQNQDILNNMCLFSLFELDVKKSGHINKIILQRKIIYCCYMCDASRFWTSY